MKLGEVNAHGLGTCPICKKWKPLSSLHPNDKKKPRKERRKICGACYAKLQRTAEPFFFAKKAISAHKSMAQEGDYKITDVKELHRWQAFLCPYCNAPIHYSFTIEHIVPRSQGGRNILSNILLICTGCNSSKQAFETVYWLEEKGYKVKPKILLKIQGAYDDHGYEFSGNCRHCAGCTDPNLCTKTGPGIRQCLSFPNGKTDR